MLVGLHEWPLIVYTTFAQTAIGALICLALAQLSGSLDSQQMVTIRRSQFFIWLLMAVAVLMSVLHLGSPLRAFNSLLRVGASNLSNEILATALFLGIGGLYWLAAITGKLSGWLEKLWLIITMLAGLYLLYAMCQVYQISTVPTWHNGFTSLNFIITTLLSGAVFGALLLSIAIKESPFTSRVLPIITILALIISQMSQLIQLSELSSIQSSILSASQLVPNYGAIMAWRLGLIVVGLGFWFCSLGRHGQATKRSLIAAFILILVAEMLSRGVFYALHLTVGVTANY